MIIVEKTLSNKRKKKICNRISIQTKKQKKYRFLFNDKTIFNIDKIIKKTNYTFLKKIEKKIMHLVHDDNEHCDFDRFYERFKNYFVKNATKR